MLVRSHHAADMIFVLVDGAYYYLSLVSISRNISRRSPVAVKALEHLQFCYLSFSSSHSGKEIKARGVHSIYNDIGIIGQKRWRYRL